jgi:hypothetical protein
MGAGSGYAALQTGIAGSIGPLTTAGALSASLQPNAGATTTAINLAIVVQGIPQGLISSMTIDEQFNQQRVRAISSAVNVALIPGVYEATAQINRAFLYGVTLETAFGGGLRPVIGKYQANPDFTQFYFVILEINNQGIALATRHDCVLTSLRRAYEINQVVIIEDASILIRWSDVAGG